MYTDRHASGRWGGGLAWRDNNNGTAKGTLKLVVLFQ